MQKQQNHMDQLLALAKENPSLRIVPMIQTDVVASDEFTWWIGGFGNSSIEEIYDDGEQIHIRSIGEENLIEEIMLQSGDYLVGKDDELYAEAQVIVNDYPWEKVIAVKIGLP